MSHTAANNEIIRMRPTVRKSRVGVIWKLTKELKLLKNRKHGDEKVLKKCRRKSKRFINEIEAIKKFKDDDITKFAVMNSRSLEEVLSDPRANRVTRGMIRLAFHKHLRAAVEKFKVKFPHYKLGKRQLAKTEWKKSLGIESRVLPVEEPKTADHSHEEASGESDSEADIPEELLEKEKSEDLKEPPRKNQKLENNELKNFENSSTNEKNKEFLTSDESQETIELKERIQRDEKDVKKSFDKRIKVVSNVAAVKRLKITDSLEEEEEEIKKIDLPSTEEKIHLIRENDSFFISGNGGDVYKSVIVKKPNSLTNDADEMRKSTSKWRDSVNYRENWNFDRDKNAGDKISFRKNRKDLRGNGFVGDRSLMRENNKFEDNKSRDRGEDRSEENLHPSWAARKKQQEALKQGFQGKKIVFSDD